ncbi:MAG: hypothetical protein L0H24_00135 [Microlunatus sp.]|nr:hypothetical protein [Microlunatus sp.]
MTSNRARKAEARTYQAETGSRYVVARLETGPRTLAAVMREHPMLDYFGIGAFDPIRKTAEQRRTEIADGRHRLVAHEADVAEVAEWLRENITPIKTPGFGSYGLKHLAEERIGRYVSNGEAIAAALIVGYTFRYETPNVAFRMSRKDVHRLQASSR